MDLQQPSEQPTPPSSKRQRLDQNAPEDFSTSVRKKLSSSTRTGQACDRCKVRKIRCDAAAGACTPCRTSNSTCKTTDRITGRATTRGHTDRLEDENRYFKQRVFEYEQRLKSLGVDPQTIPTAFPYTPSAPLPQSSNWGATNHESPAWMTEQHGTNAKLEPNMESPTGKSATALLENDVLQSLPIFRAGSLGDNYLGVSPAGSVFSLIKGTSLSFFGMELNLADFAPGSDDPASPTSYRNVLKVGLGKVAVKPARLPGSQDECEMYASWYFRSLNPYSPVLHKPAMYDLIHKLYNVHQFEPTVPQTVMIHMMLAHLKYQFSARNGNTHYLEESHSHFRYSLARFPDLLIEHSLEAVQALTLLTIHLRNFHKPGAAWIVGHIAFALAIELGLHRSAKVWKDRHARRDPHEIEMRKRVFWILHALHTALSGKLGRPMPIRMEDIDVELPEPVPDNLPNEIGLSDFRKCSFHVGIQAMKVGILFNRMYNTMYAVRQSSSTQEETVRKLEEYLREWRAGIPPQLSDPSRAVEEERVQSLYIQFWGLELQLLMHHPALFTSASADFLAANEEICLDVANKMLDVISQLRALKSLDMPWIMTTVYLAAIFTTLFVHDRRKAQLTPADMEKLRSDMITWLDIMGDIGNALGSGENLPNALRAIIEQALGRMGVSLFAPGAPKHPSDHDNDPSRKPVPELYPNASVYSPALNDVTTSTPTVAAPTGTTYLPPDDPSLMQQSTPYPAAARYAFSQPASLPLPAYAASANAFDAAPYMPVGQGGLAGGQGGLPGGQGGLQGGQNSLSGAQTPLPTSEWLQWTQTTFPAMGMGGHAQPAGFHHIPAASALMTLGSQATAQQAQGADWPLALWQQGGSSGV